MSWHMAGGTVLAGVKGVTQRGREGGYKKGEGQKGSGGAAMVEV